MSDTRNPLDFFLSEESLQGTPKPVGSGVLVSKFEPAQHFLLWFQTARSAVESSEELISDPHSGVEALDLDEKECEACGGTHGYYTFSIYAKSHEEIERLRGAIHREMAEIMRDRGALTS